MTVPILFYLGERKNYPPPEPLRADAPFDESAAENVEPATTGG